MLRTLLIALAGLVMVSAAFLALRGGGSAICNAEEAELQAPSGRALQLCEVLYEVQPSSETWAVIRVLDPQIGSACVGQSDHDWACDTWGLPALNTDPRPTRIIVQIIEHPFERGEPNPGISQSIEAYSEENNLCAWELL